ncbi:renalase-like isoform X5 [Apostichopus japonicus]|uniref:renalase-like isoform X5 n=1 Tax=Stichopus japonicus TaxID=307972 RepID=UPI003AB4E00E
MVPRVLVTGAGPTGAICAHILRKELQDKVHIDVWDKSNGTGGRMSTSRDPENSECTADLGAQYLTVTPDYAQDHESYYAELISVGLTQELSGGIEGIKSSRYPANTKHYVTPQGISSIVKHFLMKSEEKPSVKEKLEKVNYSSRYALALFFPPGVTPDVPWNARYEQEDECIRWISIDNKKRQNEEACSAVVVHTSVPFGIKHLEADKQLVEQIIKQHLDNLMPNLPSPVRSKCQRWRYSQVSTPYEGSPGTLVLAEGPSYILLVAGDGMSHSNFDGCIASAEATCKKLIHHWKTNSQL